MMLIQMQTRGKMVIFSNLYAECTRYNLLHHRETEDVVRKSPIGIVRSHHCDQMQVLTPTNKL